MTDIITSNNEQNDIVQIMEKLNKKREIESEIKNYENQIIEMTNKKSLLQLELDKITSDLKKYKPIISKFLSILNTAGDIIGDTNKKKECEQMIEETISGISEMPKELENDTRFTYAFIDLQNVVNSIVFEPINSKAHPKLSGYKLLRGEERQYFKPSFIEVILEVFVWCFKHVEKIIIYTTDTFKSINDYINEIINDGHKEIELKYVKKEEEYNGLYPRMMDKYDNAMIDDIWTFACNKTSTNQKYARVIIFTGDSDFLDAVNQILEKKINVHIISHIIGLHNDYKKLAMTYNSKIKIKPINNEYPLMYHIFYTNKLKEWENQIFEE